MNKITWNSDNTITVTPPKRPKKCTGTRFAAIRNLNKWTTPFNAWCAITRTYEEPFEDTIYTVAGKTIEPKQANYMKEKYFYKHLVTPEDVFGKDYFNKTYGDFYHDEKIFGGMWDYLFVDEENRPTCVMEMKTTKRSEDWINDVPEYYAEQAALYAYLLGVDDVIMVCTILEDSDYEHPETFEVNSTNTFERAFKVSERYPNMDQMIQGVEQWWEEHVVNGVSPTYDEKLDADILKALRNTTVSKDTDLKAIIDEAEALKDKLEEYKLIEKRYKELSTMIRDVSISNMTDGDKTATVAGNKYVFTVTKSQRTSVDTEALKNDGLYEKYSTTKEEYRVTTKAIKEEK